ncbi:CsbD family protein [Streptosporangium sp. NPDC002544]|uniref:CsbD family protein n=1 Tax=unclassified Streptosporangium TaxID=2632669 RepID=UPI003319472B
MGADDKLSNKAQEAKGKIKEGVGRATGDERLAARGKDDQARSRLKQAGEKAKDSAKKVKDAFKS